MCDFSSYEYYNQYIQIKNKKLDIRKKQANKN